MNRTRTGLIGRLVILAVLLVAPLVMAGCGENLDPTQPEGAYNLFRKALVSGDAEAVWQRLAPSSHEYFDEQYERLEKMDATIERYLPATDHKLAREQAGSILTDQVEGGKGLFLKVFSGASMPEDAAYEVGMNIEEVTVTEDEQSAKLLTRGGQTFILTRVEGSEEWFVMLVRSKEMSAAVKKSLGWLDANESALDKTVEDLIEEEKAKREALIAELMDLQANKGGADKAE
jgi:hypothetical protein